MTLPLGNFGIKDGKANKEVYKQSGNIKSLESRASDKLINQVLQTSNRKKKVECDKLVALT